MRLGPHSSAGLGKGMFAFKNLLFGYERAKNQVVVVLFVQKSRRQVQHILEEGKWKS